MTATIEPLLRSPRLPAFVDELQSVLAGVIVSQAIRSFSIPVRAIFDAQVNLRTLGQLTQGLGPTD